MFSKHATTDELASLAKGIVNPDLAGHLFSCIDCWLSATDFLVDAKPSGSTPTINALIERYRLEQTQIEEKLSAKAAIGDLRSLEMKHRREQVGRNKRYHSRLVVELLLAEARTFRSPLESEEWAGLALVAAQQLPRGKLLSWHCFDLIAESYAELANARRRSARWKAAREALEQGLENASRGSRSPAVEGALLSVAGAIDSDTGEVGKARAVLERAATCFDAAGEPALVARTYIQLGHVLAESDPRQSLDFIRRAFPLIPLQDHRLLLFAEGIRVNCLITLGGCREAVRRFDGLAALYDQFSEPFIQLRRTFTEGRLLEALGRYEDADARFHQVLVGDLEYRFSKSLFLDLIYLLGSQVKRGDFGAALQVCRRAINDLAVLEIDGPSEESMRDLWNKLTRQVQGKAITLTSISRCQAFIRYQWRTALAEIASVNSAI